jgi:hypothetical protein
MTESETGRIEGIGENDDRAISWMLACIGYLKLMRMGVDAVSISDTTEPVKSNSISWRDQGNNLLIPFIDIFGGKSKVTGKRSVHCQ